MKYLDKSSVLATRHTQAPRNRRADGYGSKIPTGLEIQLKDDKRWRRVYVVCWSNSGTAYAIVGGEAHYITDRTHQDLIEMSA